MLDVLVPTVVLSVVGLAVYGRLAWHTSHYCFDDAVYPQRFRDWCQLAPRAFLDVHIYPLSRMNPRAAWYLWARTALALCGESRRVWVLLGTAMHVLNGGLLAWLAMDLGASPGTAWLTAALFVAHPMAVPTVAFIGGTPSALILLGLLTGTLLLLHGAVLTALLLGVLVSYVKYDGWLYWVHLGLVWAVLR